MAHVLLAGESWIQASSDYKGFDEFSHTQLNVGCTDFLKALRSYGHTVDHILAHDVATDFPETQEKLSEYDVVIISDIGANSFLLPPQVLDEGRTFPNRLKLLASWTEHGGGLMMAGGYMSFQGFQAKANYHGSPLESVLPVEILPTDDRVEAPEGVGGSLTRVDHPITNGLDNRWPTLLGYQKLKVKDSAQTLAEVGEDPLLVVSTVSRGRSLAFASDISPHWAPREFMDWEGYEKLFGQAIDWLAQKRPPNGISGIDTTKEAT